MISDDIVQPLLTWYDANKRILPWRMSKNPYDIWVSEIMLQQTRVEAVKPYYDRFMSELPTISDLAGAQTEQLLKLWEGLGYYNRVRNLQKAAIQIMEEYDGQMPADYELIVKLPGIGSYTAGAIISIAFEKPYPAVDGNVLRILTRLSADPSDILSAKFKKQMEKEVSEIMPQTRPGDFNQAMMELGATVCLPNGAPKCEACPWRDMCQARKQCLLDKIPYKEKKKKRTIEKKTVLLIRDGDKTLIRKRPDSGLLAGLFEFPTLEGWLDEDEILQFVNSLGLQTMYVKAVEDATHIFTHREWHMKGYLIKVADTEANRNEDGMNQSEMHLIFPSEIEKKYPIPSAYKAYTKYVNIALGNEHFLR